MPSLDGLPQITRTKLLTRPVEVYHETPFTPLTAPLSEVRLAIVTTAGLHLKGDRPFTADDGSFRVIPSQAGEAELVQSHTSIGFDRAAQARDINVVFPIDRLRELVERGELGGIAENHYSLLGAQQDSTRPATVSGAELAERLLGEADVVLLTPTWPLCTHTGGVLQRVLEDAGLLTVSISLVREHTEKLRPPRALYVPFPFGLPLGRAGNAGEQHRVLRAALDLVQEPSGPVLRDYDGPYEGAGPGGALQASQIEVREPQIDVATEVTLMRRYYEQWLEREGKSTVGVSGIPPVRFRGVVRFVEAVADGQKDADHRERPDDVEKWTFLRVCVDDLKAMYLEARLMTGLPDESAEDTARWFWGETALGILLRRLRERLDETGDPALKLLAFGIAR